MKDKKKEQIEKLKQGCGKRIDCVNYHLYCGDFGMYKLRLCSNCRKKLKEMEK